MKTKTFQALAAILSLVACEATPVPLAPAPVAGRPVRTMTMPTIPSKSSDPLAEGRACTDALYGHGDLWSRFGPPARELFGDDVPGLVAFQAKIQNDLGAEREIVSEKVEKVEDVSVYRRVARFEKVAQTVEIVFGFDGAGKVVALAVRPVGAPEAAATTKLDYVTKTRRRRSAYRSRGRGRSRGAVARSTRTTTRPRRTSASPTTSTSSRAAARTAATERETRTTSPTVGRSSRPARAA